MLYAFVSLISTIHVVDFFEMTNPRWLAIALAIAFEFGAAASLAAIVVGEKTNKTIVWGLFFILTAFQMQGNMWYAYVNAVDFMSWVELFYLNDMELIEQKRMLALVSGAVLPIVALGFIKSLVDYIKPEEVVVKETVEVLEENLKPEPVKERTSPRDLIDTTVKDRYKDPEVKADVEFFGENLKKDEPSIDSLIQQKRRPNAI
jgi:hypothetical protein